jgi:hypothetical protein
MSISFLDQAQAEGVIRRTFEGTTTALVARAKASSGFDAAASLEATLASIAECVIPALAAAVSRTTLGLAVGDVMRPDSDLHALVRAAGSLSLTVTADGSVNVAVGSEARDKR